MATGIFSYSTTAATNASASSEINFAEGQSPGSVNNSARQVMADIAELLQEQGGKNTLAGGTTAYTLTSKTTVPALADGVRIHAVVNAANTGASTLAVDSLGAKKIRKVVTSGATPNDTALDAGDMQIDQHCVFEYDASADAASGAWILLNPFGTRDGTARLNKLCPHESLVLTQASNSTVTVAADAVILFDSNSNPKRFASLSETLDIGGSVGANALDTGTEASGTWYHLWAIGKADGTLDGLISASATAPTLPSGYIYKGYLGAVYNNGSSNFNVFKQLGNVATAPVTTPLSGGTQTSYTSVDLSGSVPSTATRARLRILMGTSSGTATVTGFVAPVGSTTTPTYEEHRVVSQNGIGAYHSVDMPMTTAQTAYYFVSGTNPSLTIASMGWVF